MNYKDYNDYELLNYVAEKDENASEIMLKKYEPLINGIAKKMYKYINGSGLEISDLVQEGMIALTTAMDNYQDSKEASFYTYAKTCIERKMIDTIISTTRLKHKILNNSISIDAADNGDFYSIEYLFKDDSENPENILINDETIDNLMNLANKNLTDFEQQVFELKINGLDYKEIAEVLDKDNKQIDNAIQRIKLKLKKILEKDE